MFSLLFAPDLVAGPSGGQGMLSGAQASPVWVLKITTTDSIGGRPALLKQPTHVHACNLTAREAAKLWGNGHLPALIPPFALRTRKQAQQVARHKSSVPQHLTRRRDTTELSRLARQAKDPHVYPFMKGGPAQRKCSEDRVLPLPLFLRLDR